MSYIKGKRVALSNEPTEESLAFAEYCRALFEYKEDGSLVWGVNRGRVKVGDIVSGLNSAGYLRVSIDSIEYLVHQIVFLLHNNYIPKVIDHINRVKTNNCVENLRSVTTRENSLNRNNNVETSNIYSKGSNYIVQFYIGNRLKSFGTYKTIKQAITIRDKIANDLDNWQAYLPIKPKDKPNRYITKEGNGFRIRKTINGTTKQFGKYKTLEDAIVARDKLEANNWEIITCES